MPFTAPTPFSQGQRLRTASMVRFPQPRDFVHYAAILLPLGVLVSKRQPIQAG